MDMSFPVSRKSDDKVVVATPDLESLLKNAPSDVEYKPHTNGFYLMNKALRIEYIQVYFGGNNGVGLWFLEPYPKIKVSTEFTDMQSIPKSLLCSNITAHTGNTWSFTFPLYEDEPAGNTIGISMFDHFGDKKVTPEQEKWFDYGTRLLKGAAVKYDLKRWYDVYNGKEVVIGGKPKLGLGARISRFLPF
ncbi:MAG: hypothetical protein V1645_01235 [archaeon]